MKKILTLFGVMIICSMFSTNASAQVPRLFEMNGIQTEVASDNTDKVDALGLCDISILVKDSELGDSLAGVIVFVKDTSMGVATDVNGTAQLLNAPCPCIIVLQYIGYQIMEIYIVRTTSITVSLLHEQYEEF